MIVNTGSSLIEQQLQPGLAVKLSKTVKKVGKKTVVTWFAQALDDGFGVASATFTAGGHTVHANAAGKASLKEPAERLSEGCGARLRGRRVPSPLAGTMNLWL